MGEEEFRKFKEAIWITRISRIHSEKRLLEKENFCRILNVYYSFLTIVLSILSFVKKDDLLCLSAIFMSIFLLVAILYLLLKFIDKILAQTLSLRTLTV